ncbi:MAG: S8 family serine peptidase, partial [Chloroflexota bacterium]|nr:S8 family serine peptidase [Chloroflexota bacterium]
MAKSGRNRRDDDQANDGRTNGQADMPGDGPGAVPMPGTTGRFLVLMREDAVPSAVRTLSEDAGLNIASTADFDDGVADAEGLAGSDALVFDELAVAVVDAPPAQLQGLSVAGDSGIIAIEPERVVYALQTVETGVPHHGLLDPIAPVPVPAPSQPQLNGGTSMEYLRGYRDAVNHIADKLLADAGMPGMAGETAELAPAQVDESEATWGLQITKAISSQYSGKGIRVAVLDTGMDLGHPDFTGRTIVSQSFITGQSVQDGHGHGTH